jgi:hypothetical protein
MRNYNDVLILETLEWVCRSKRKRVVVVEVIV